MLENIANLNGHDDRAWCVSWNPTGTLLASSSGDKTVRIWAKKPKQDGSLEWKCVDTLSDGHTRTIRWVSWSPCGNRLATASFDTSITLWKKNQQETFEIEGNLEGHENEVKCTAWSDDGQFLASCSRDRTVWIWDVSEGEDFECSAVLSMHNQDVKHVLWHPNKNLLASSSYDNSIRFSVQDDDDWTSCANLSGHDGTVWASDFNKDGSKLISCSEDKTLKIWMEQDGTLRDKTNMKWNCVSTVSGYHSRGIFSVKWSKVTGLIATACSDNSIHIFKENSEALPGASCMDNEVPYMQLLCRKENAHSQDVNCVDWNPVEEGLLASCSDDGSVKIWKFIE